jgi:hypothetical protein
MENTCKIIDKPQCPEYIATNSHIQQRFGNTWAIIVLSVWKVHRKPLKELVYTVERKINMTQKSYHDFLNIPHIILLVILS